MREYGFKNKTSEHMALIEQQLSDHGLTADPHPSTVAPTGWIHLSLTGDRPTEGPQPSIPRPADAWFEHLQKAVFDTEREVESHFVSPVFRALGYSEEQEALGYRFTQWEGVKASHPEADLVYFQTGDHSLDSGNPLVLVECKKYQVNKPFQGEGQVRSYAYWIKPVYYVVADGERITVWLYQGGAIPDHKELELQRTELKDRFDELHAKLNYDAALEAKRQAVAKYRKSSN